MLINILLSGCEEEERSTRADKLSTVKAETECHDNVTVEIGEYTLSVRRLDAPTVAIYDDNGNVQRFTLSRREHCDINHMDNVASLYSASLRFWSVESNEKRTSYHMAQEKIELMSDRRREESGLIFYGEERDSYRLFIIQDGIPTYNKEPVLLDCHAFFCDVSYVYDKNMMVGYSFRAKQATKDEFIEVDNHFRSRLGALIIKSPKEGQIK
jgi:hypothetical protein